MGRQLVPSRSSHREFGQSEVSPNAELAGQLQSPWLDERVRLYIIASDGHNGCAAANKEMDMGEIKEPLVGKTVILLAPEVESKNDHMIKAGAEGVIVAEIPSMDRFTVRFGNDYAEVAKAQVRIQ